jgi:PAS domain S-box-containing protein
MSPHSRDGGSRLRVMAAADRHSAVAAAPGWGAAAQAMYRAAQAVAQPGGPRLFADLVQELAQALPAACVFVAVFTDERRLELRTLAAVLDGQPLREFSYAVSGSPCAQVVGHSFRYVASGVAAEFPPGTIFGAKGMDAYAAFPLNDSSGTPLGLVVAMGRQPIADAALCEALLKIVAGRITAELERGQADDALRAAALAVSGAGGEAVFAELVRLLTTILHVDAAFISSHDAADPQRLHTLAMVCDRQLVPKVSYALAGTPCATVLGQCFRAYPSGVGTAFPDDADLRALGIDAYAGHPLLGRQGEPLGTIGVVSRQPLTVPLERVESVLQIFAVRAAAEIEQLTARQALRRSEASYRAIFEAAEDAIFIHDWDTGEVLDVNPKACATYGYSHDELCRVSLGEVSSGVPPHTAETALQHLQLARLGRAQPFEWHRRNKDGSLHWDEVRLKAVEIDGQRRILAFTREITERKAALAALEAREEQYRAVFDGSSDAMALWNRELRIVDINRAFTRLFGYARDEVVGRSFGSRISPDAKARRVQLIRAALDGREGAMETDGVRKDGSRFEIELRYLPIAYAGEPHVLAIGRDISARRAADQALRDSEAQYRAIFNASADALVLRAADFSIVDVNATYESMSGYTRAEVLGVDRVLANPPEVTPTIRALHDRALAGEAVALETQLLRRDGQRYELELRGVPIRHRGVPHVLFIGRDITERKRGERALRDSEEQYRAIFNASADGLVLRDADFHAVEVNPTYVAMSGYSREEVMAADQVLTQSDAAVMQRHRAEHELALGGRELSYEVTATRKDGSQMQVEVRGMPVMYRGRQHVLYSARDITERHAAEQRRGELERQLRQAQKMEAIGQLTGGIAHDFNNILTSVIGYLVLGLERAETLGDDRLQRQLGQAHLAAQRARDLIAQMLAFARRQRGERRIMPLAPLVRQTLQLLRATLPATVAVDDAALAAGEDEDDGDAPRVAADAVQLEQVLFNLCINARDAIHGPGLIRVRLRSSQGGWHCSSCRARVDHGRWVELSVADSGEGMPPAVLERVFEPFYSTKEVGRGSGMGLAMMHGIVHDHGGHVVVQSAPGAGSEFRVLLPPAAADAVGAPPAQGARSAAGAARELPHARVMVVEDETMVGDFMAELLSGWGLDVVLQRDPLQAAAWLDEPANALDLLVTDHTMPQMTGLALAQHAAAVRPGLPVLLYTGNAAGVDKDEAQRHGVRAVLRKPVDPPALRATLRRCLQTQPADSA